MWYWDAILATYGIGWGLAVPGSLRRYMLKPKCPRCVRGTNAECYQYAYHMDGKVWNHLPAVPRGAVIDRDGWAVAAAAFTALWWPFRLAWSIASGAVRLFGRMFAQTVMKVTALTEPELERLEQQRTQEIDRLSREIAE